MLRTPLPTFANLIVDELCPALARFRTILAPPIASHDDLLGCIFGSSIKGLRDIGADLASFVGLQIRRAIVDVLGKIGEQDGCICHRKIWNGLA